MCKAQDAVRTAISFPELRSHWPAVGKRELWEHPFQACVIARHRCRLRLRSDPDNQNSVISYCYFKMDAPKALVFLTLVKGNETLGTRLRRLTNTFNLTLKMVCSPVAQRQLPTTVLFRFTSHRQSHYTYYRCYGAQTIFSAVLQKLLCNVLTKEDTLPLELILISSSILKSLNEMGCLWNAAWAKN